MRPRSLLVLALVVLALGAFVWFYERQLPGSEEREAQANRLVPGLEPAEVTAVEIEHGDEGVRIERKEVPAEVEEAEAADAGGEAPEAANAPGAPAAGWRLTAPEALAGADADRVAVDSLLSALAALDKSRTLEELDREALGLEPPRVRVTLERGSGDPVVLEVGADLPASSDMVVLRADTGEAHLVDRTILQDLTRAAGEWRSREMFTASRQQVARVTLAGGTGGAVVLERAGDGFRLLRPFADVADPEAVDQLLSALSRLSAERFVDDPAASLAELGLEPPRGRVTVELVGGGPARAIEVGAPRAEGDGTTFRVGGQVFVAESELPAAIARPAARWRSPALTDLELYRIDRLTVEDASGRLELARSGTDWRRGEATISYTPVSDLLFSLVEARAEEIVPRAAAAPGPPQLTIEIAADAGGEGQAAERQTIAFHSAAEDGLVPVTVSGREVVLRVPAAEVDAIRADLGRVRAAEPVTGGEDAEVVPEGIAIEREEG